MARRAKKINTQVCVCESWASAATARPPKPGTKTVFPRFTNSRHEMFSRGVNTPPERDLKTCVCTSLRERVTCMCGDIGSSSGSLPLLLPTSPHIQVTRSRSDVHTQVFRSLSRGVFTPLENISCLEFVNRRNTVLTEPYPGGLCVCVALFYY